MKQFSFNSLFTVPYSFLNMGSLCLHRVLSLISFNTCLTLPDFLKCVAVVFLSCLITFNRCRRHLAVSYFWLCYLLDNNNNKNNNNNEVAQE